MADYDNTDKGAAFKPFQDQSLVLQGKINDDGSDRKVVLVKDITLLATLRRIKRKADIMVMDALKNSVIEHNARELQILAEIALRCVEGGK